MFSDNNFITIRQLRLLLILDIFGILGDKMVGYLF